MVSYTYEDLKNFIAKYEENNFIESNSMTCKELLFQLREIEAEF